MNWTQNPSWRKTTQMPDTMPLEFEPDKSTAGYRLHELSLYNWGTFHGKVHTLRPDGRTAAILGPNGSGKTTLVDALLTLLVPSRRRNYNMASAQINVRERDERQYVRGIFAERHDENGHPRREQLRKDGEHYTVLLARFHNVAYSQDVTLAQVLWVVPASGRIEKTYVVHEGALTIEQHFNNLDNQSNIKKALKQKGLKLYDTFTQYSERFHKHLFMEAARQRTPMAIFNQAVCIKDIRDLNTFIREHMLDDGGAAQKLRELHDHFGDLKATHDEIQSATRKLEDLIQIEKARGTWAKQDATVRKLRCLIRAVEPWLQSAEAALRREQAIRLEAERAALQIQHKVFRQKLHDFENNLKQLDRDIRESESGRRLGEIEQELKRLHTELTRVQNCLERFSKCLTHWDPQCQIENATAFVSLQTKLNSELPVLEEKLNTTRNEYSKQAIALESHVSAIQETEAELRHLEEQGTNIPSAFAIQRTELAEALGCDLKKLPFIGELVQVAKEQGHWIGPIERLLRPFGLTLLIPPEFAAAAETYLDENSLRGRLACLCLDPEMETTYDPPADTIVTMLDLHPESSQSNQKGLRQEIARRFPHQCCESLDGAFQRANSALTPKGLIKDRGTLREKDDTFSLDKASWHILGWETHQKKQALQGQLNLMEVEQKKHNAQLEKLQEQIGQLEKQQDAGKRLTEIARNYSEIDKASLSRRIDEQEKEEKRILESSDQLKTLKAEVKKIEKAKQSCEEEESKCSKNLTLNEDEQRRNNEALKDCQAIMTAFASETHAEHSTFEILSADLEKRFGKPPSRIEDMKSLERKAKNEIEDSVNIEQQTLNAHRDKLRQTMQRFVDDPLNQCHRDLLETDFQGEPTEEQFQPFASLRARIEKDDLPKIKARFEKKLHHDVITHVSNFKNSLEDLCEQIKDRIKELNAHLRRVTFDRGEQTYIQLVWEINADRRIKSFRNELQTALDNSLHQDEDEQLHRYRRVEQLLNWLKQEDNRSSFVIDVRNWFTFRADERKQTNDALKESYSGASGKSGGEKNRLASTILATAIAYQYGIDVGDCQTETFRLVVVDEMFSKTDDDFSEYLLQLFKEFHLQLLIIQPLDPKVHIVQKFAERFHIVSKQGNCSRVQDIGVHEFREALNGKAGTPLTSQAS